MLVDESQKEEESQPEDAERFEEVRRLGEELVACPHSANKVGSIVGAQVVTPKLIPFRIQICYHICDHSRLIDSTP